MGRPVPARSLVRVTEEVEILASQRGEQRNVVALPCWPRGPARTLSVNKRLHFRK